MGAIKRSFDGLFGSSDPGKGERREAQAVAREARERDRKAQIQQQEVRVQQQAFAQVLQGQMAGTGPSLAQNQLQQATDRNTSQAAGFAASLRGANPALAQRTAQMAQAQANQQAASDSAIIRAQEQLSAQNQFGNLISGIRAQDLGNSQMQTNTDQGQRQSVTNMRLQQEQNDNNLLSGIAQGIASVASSGGKKYAGGVIEGKEIIEDVDHPINDTVPITVSPGEVVVPKTIAQTNDPKVIGDWVKKAQDASKYNSIKKALKAKKKKDK